MSKDRESDVLRLLQPELLSSEELLEMIKTRCPKVQNLSSAPKERLVRLFRQMILPLPQRLYRTNRRGKLLTARRLKAGLEAKPMKERGETGSLKSTFEKSPLKKNERGREDDRLKPPPDSKRPNKIRLNSETNDSKRSKTDLDKIVINDRRRHSREEERRHSKDEERKHSKDEERRHSRDEESDHRSNSESSSSNRKIVLKRSNSFESERRHSSNSSPSQSSSDASPKKKARTAIKWP